jgi:ferritin
MLTEKMQAALNAQVNAEYYSSYLYLSMAAYFEAQNLRGFANWMRVQVQEENFHAMKFYDYIIQRGGRVILQAIDTPSSDWASPLAVFEAAYKHEQHITELINKLMGLSFSESDFASNSFLQWFVNEQVEEEANASGIVSDLKRAGTATESLFRIDRELAARVFTPPASAGA